MYIIILSNVHEICHIIFLQKNVFIRVTSTVDANISFIAINEIYKITAIPMHRLNNNKKVNQTDRLISTSSDI
jgi:hypothetical protein